MTISPRKNVSNFTGTTTERGVEAKEVEIANIRLDMNVSNSSQGYGGGAARESEGAPAAHPAPPTDDAGSYLQVVVHKHRSRRAARVARASSPLPPAPAPAPACDTRLLLLPHSMLVPCPGLAATSEPVCEACRMMHCCGDQPAPAPPTLSAGGETTPSKKNINSSTLKKIETLTNPSYGCDDNGPECVEVYYFERGSGDYLCAAAGAGGEAPWVERAARRAARPAARLLAELCAAPRLLLALPVHLLLHLERCVLSLVQGAVCGAVGALSDHALKPALALTFNALVQPPLVCAGNVLRAVREALRPLWAAAGDALEPAARVLAAVRLVQVHVHTHNPSQHSDLPQ